MNEEQKNATLLSICCYVGFLCTVVVNIFEQLVVLLIGILVICISRKESELSFFFFACENNIIVKAVKHVQHFIYIGFIVYYDKSIINKSPFKTKRQFLLISTSIYFPSNLHKYLQIMVLTVNPLLFNSPVNIFFVKDKISMFVDVSRR